MVWKMVGRENLVGKVMVWKDAVGKKDVEPKPGYLKLLSQLPNWGQAPQVPHNQGKTH